MKPLPPQDIAHVLKQSTHVWNDLQHAKLFLTGCTGFFGLWLLESLVAAKKQFGLNIHATVLTRDQRKSEDHFAHLLPSDVISFLEGDVRSFVFPEAEITHIIHGATDASAQLDRENPAEMEETIVEGAKRVLSLATEKGVRRFLLLSSGAVYGPQPTDVMYLSEEMSLPDTETLTSAYARGKQIAESLCLGSQLPISIARCFAFVGPGLPLDQHFAIGNFIGNALRGEPIEITGDGTPHRSYLYGSDLAIWLWTILTQGRSGEAYNVGSSEDYSIQEVAEIISQTVDPPVEIAITHPPSKEPPSRYVPDVSKAATTLNLMQTIGLEDATARTIAWYG